MFDCCAAPYSFANKDKKIHLHDNSSIFHRPIGQGESFRFPLTKVYSTVTVYNNLRYPCYIVLSNSIYWLCKCFSLQYIHMIL